MSNKIAWIWGSHPLLACAELYAQDRLNLDTFFAFNQHGLVCKSDQTMAPLDQFGSLTRQVEVFQAIANPVQTTDLSCLIADYLSSNTSKKVTFGLSIFDQTGLWNQENENLCQLVKHNLSQKGLKSRYLLPGSANQLNAAQVISNQLHLSPRAAEIVLLCQVDKCFIGQTRQIQDINRYRQRDEGRPYRIHQEGMLPVKLAQIMLNLAQVKPGQSMILDPFCGSGTILQEALYKSCPVVGTDLSRPSLEKCRANLRWFTRHQQTVQRDWTNPGFQLFDYDAKRVADLFAPSSFDAIVTEGYLGQLFSQSPSDQSINQELNQLSQLYKASLRSLFTLLKPSARLVICLPYYLQSKRSLLKLIVDDIQKIGYNHLSLLPLEMAQHLRQQTDQDFHSYIYSRPGQIVGRQIIILQKP